jgi:hypothetical protein
MTHLPAAIAIRLQGKTSFNVAMTVIEELCAENAALRAEKEKLAAENKRLQDQLAQLQAKLGRAAKTAKNSSLPPSQETKPNGGANGEPATDKPQPRRGHPGAHRLLCDTPTVVKDMRAEVCPHCAADVSGVAQSEGETYEHVEIPRAPAAATRVVRRHGTCPCCCQAFKGAPPPGMEPGSPFGENVQATVLHRRHGPATSDERTATLLDVPFGVKLSAGALASMLKAAAPAFAAQVAPIRQRLRAAR